MQQALRQGSVLCFNYEQKKASITRIVQWILARMYTTYSRAWKKWHDATLLHRTQLMPRSCRPLSGDQTTPFSLLLTPPFWPHGAKLWVQ